MRVDVMLRRRAALSESISMLNAHFIEQFTKIRDFWDPVKTATDARFENAEATAGTYLHAILENGISGQIHYIGRFEGYLSRDIAQSDDFLVLRLDTNKVDYANFCSITLSKLIEIFAPYRVAAETDNAVKLDDFDITRQQSKETGRNINGRDSVYRIWPVCFFDDLLCQRAFGIGAAEIVARAAPECERAELLYGGAFLLVTSEIVVGPALDALNARLMACLDMHPATLKGAA